MNEYICDFQLKEKKQISDLSFVTIGTVEYQWLLKPLSLLLYKYWGNVNIIYFSDRRTNINDLPPNVEFRPVPFIKWNWLSDFGNGLRYIFEQISDEIVLLTLLDMWPKNYIRLDRIRILIEYLKANKDILRILIGDDTNYLGFGYPVADFCGLDIITAKKNNLDVAGEVGFMLTPSLWNREIAAKYISNCSIWDFEQLHTNKLKYDNVRSAWTRQSIYPYWHVLSRSDIGKKIFIHQLLKEDASFIKQYLPIDVEVYE